MPVIRSRASLQRVLPLGEEKHKTRVSMRYVSIDDIRPYPQNPRNNERAIAALVNSIREFGFLVPVLLDDDGELIAGHTRFEAAKILGMDEVPAIDASHLSEEAIKAFRIIDNKTAELSEWNTEMLGAEISLLMGVGIDFTDFGFSQEEVDCLAEAVSDDCLSGEAVQAATDDENQPSMVRGRGPDTVRVVVGEFVFHIARDPYLAWSNALKIEGDYVSETIVRLLKGRLGIVPFEEGAARHGGAVRRRRARRAS